MAGIGVKLTNIYKKNTLTTDIIGVGYSICQIPLHQCLL